ncbi:MAG: hypothetical protein V4696_13410 [Pseudomonadota bacterium]
MIAGIAPLSDWPEARGLIAESVDRDDALTLGEVEEALGADLAQLWTVRDGGVVLAAVTQLLALKGGRQAYVWQMGGDFERGSDALVPAFLEWAAREGCVSAEMNGRLGWRKKLPDWRMVSVTLRKELR